MDCELSRRRGRKGGLNPYAREALAAVLAELAKSLPPERAADLLDYPIRTLAASIAKWPSSDERKYLARGLAAMTKALAPSGPRSCSAPRSGPSRT